MKYRKIVEKWIGHMLEIWKALEVFFFLFSGCD